MQSTTKSITRGTKHVDIYQHDLWTPAQKTEFAEKPNYDANIAGVTMPFSLRLGVLGRLIGSEDFDELIILSDKR